MKNASSKNGSKVDDFGCSIIHPTPNPPFVLMESQRNQKRIIPVRKGEIIAVHGDLSLADHLTFQLEIRALPGSNIRPVGEMLLDFKPGNAHFDVSLGGQTTFAYVAQNLEGKFTGKTEAGHWLKAFGLEAYASQALAELPEQARYRLLFLHAVSRPVCVLRMTHSRNFEGFALFLLDVKRFFRDHKLGMFCPGFVVLEERETPEMAVVADGVVVVKGKSGVGEGNIRG